MNQELKKIKKYYGEAMMHLCSGLFPTILEHEGMLFGLLENNFAYSKFLYYDIVNNHKVQDFQNYLLSFALKDKNLIISDKDPFTLMDEAGYDLYECKTEKEVAKFSKYYEPTERICTFYNHRTYDHKVFFAIKKDVETIKRGDFSNPKREDRYGTSVISIQFTNGKINSLSIKNRYNHVVDNPDATYSNNLDNIIPGLTDSFQKYFHLNIFPEDYFFTLPGYYRSSGGKLYKYNYEINDVYYCPNNIIINDGKAIEYDHEKYLIADYFIIDLVNKKIKLYDLAIDDCFVINEPINKIEITNETYGKKICISCSNYFINLKLNKFNQIIAYESNKKEIGDCFLFFNHTLKSFINNNLETIGSEFLVLNDTIENLMIPKVNTIGNNFLEENTTLEYYDLSSLKKVGDNFLKNSTMAKMSCSNLEIVGNGFLGYNKYLIKIDLPNLKQVGNFFLQCNTFLLSINFPNLEIVGSNFIVRNYRINEVSLPKLKFIGDEFLANNEDLITLDLPCVRDIGKNFLGNNHLLKYLEMPNALTVDNNFLSKNENLVEFIAPNLVRVGDSFLENNYDLDCINLENLEMAGNNFLYSNNDITKVNLPKLKICGQNFLYHVKDLSLRNMPFLDLIHAKKQEKKLVKKK